MSANDPVRASLWRDLSEAAKAWAASPKAVEGQALSDAAKAWAGAAHPRAKDTTASVEGAVFPNYGRSKGMPVKGASRQDLEFYKSGCERSLGDQSKARFHDKERALLSAIEEELGA